MGWIDRLKMALSVSSKTNTQKMLSSAAWKKGLDGSLYSKDNGVTQPMRDSSIVYTCVSKIASNLPQAVLKFYRGEDEISTSDPIVRLFSKPNPDTNQAMFLEKSTMFFALYGEVFWYMVESVAQSKGIRNLPAELIVLNPNLMKEVIKDGKLVGWMYNNKVALDLNEVLHIMFPNPYSEIRGMSPIDGIQADMDSDYLSGKYSKQFFVNGAAPSTVFTTHEDDESTPEQKKEFLKQWNALHQGVKNSHKAAILNAGADVKTIGLTQEQMAYVESRKFSAQRIMAAFGVPPAVGGDWDAANYSNAVVAKQIFWHETLAVYLRRYENMINSFIVEPYDLSLRAKFDLTEVNELQKDAKQVAEIVTAYAGLGVPMNVLAEVYKLPFGNIPGLDTGYMNISSVPVGSDYRSEDTTDDKIYEISSTKNIEQRNKSIRTRYLNLTSKYEKLFLKELKRYWFNQRSKIIEKLLNKKDETFEISILLNRIDVWSQEDINLDNRFRKVYNEILEESGTSALENIGQPTTGFIVSKEIIDERISVLRSINNTTEKTVKRIVEEGIGKGKSVQVIANDIKGFYSNITKTRAMKIARTETCSAVNTQQAKTYASKGVNKKQWVGGTRDSHKSVNGTIVGINETFSVGGSQMLYPGDSKGAAKEIISCTCCIIPVIE